MKRLLCLLIFIPQFFLSKAGVVSGKVTDTKGVEMPFAIVFVQGTTIGTSANAQGVYQLNLQPGNYKIVCQQMGFKQTDFSISIVGNETINHDFKLTEQQMEMKEFVVKSNSDPAQYIMRKVIAKRRYYEKFITSFETGIYLKGAFKTRQTPKKIFGQKVDAAEMGLDSNKRGILYLCEEVATYFSKGKQRKTLIHSVKESGEPNGMGFSQFPPVINIYQNNVPVSPQLNPRGFISPLNDNAFYYYKYKLLGDFTEAGKTIYKIKVTPKRLFEPLFDGVLFIVDEDWSVHSLSLTTTKKSNLEVLDTFKLEQTYLPLQKDNWVIKQQVLDFALKIFGFDIYGYMTTVYNNQKVNQPIPDSVFADKIVSVYDKTATKKDSAYWNENRPIPLQAEESKDYSKKDSLRLVYENPKRVDSVRRKENRFKPTKLLLSGYDYYGKEEKFIFRTNSLISGLVNYNTVEGWNIAPKFTLIKQLDSFKSLSSVIAIRYGFNNEHTNAIGRVAYTFRDKNWIGRSWSVGVEGGKYVFQLNPANPIDPLFNTITTLFERHNYMKIYERWQAGLFASKNYGNGLRWSSRLNVERRLPLENTTDYSVSKSANGEFTDNLPLAFQNMGFEKYNAVIFKVGLSNKPGISYTQYPDYKMANGSKWPTFSLLYQKGIPNILNSKVDYDKWQLSVNDQMSLKIFGSLNYHVSLGGFLNKNWVGIPDLNQIVGNQYTIASSYMSSFQLAPYYEYSNHKRWSSEAHVEWHLNGFITNKIPLFRQMRWYAVAGCNLYYFNTQNYSEAFIGIDNFGYNKFRMFRIDFVQSWDTNHQLNSGIRIGLHLNGITINLGDNSHTSEW